MKATLGPATLLLLLFLAITTDAAEDGFYHSREAIVLADRVNVRAKTSIASEVVTQLSKGDTVVVLGETTKSNLSGCEKLNLSKFS